MITPAFNFYLERCAQSSILFFMNSNMDNAENTVKQFVSAATGQLMSHKL